MKHSKSIDGLRAFAILPVMIGHAFHSVLPGGFLGVDIFFVISGFLITSLIISATDKKTFSLWDFYKRRLLRITPLVFLILFVSLVVGIILLPPQSLREMSKAVFATPIFASNILFWMQSGYFDAAAASNPLVHTWSLAVEEQFYLLAPIMALLLIKSRKLFIGFMATITIVSLFIAWKTSHIVPSTWFFFTLNRMWEISVGSLAALVYRSGFPSKVNVFGANILSIIAFGIIMTCMVFMGPLSRHPGLITLLPVVSTAVLLCLHDRPTLINQMFSLKIFIFIGLISYSLYLWHQPILAFARYLHISPLSPLIAVLCLCLSGVLAYGSYRFVETPFRNYKKFSLRQTFTGFTVASATTMIAALIVYFSGGLPQRFDDAKYQILTPPQATPFQGDLSPLNGKRIVFWGDSHAQMYAKAITPILENSQVTAELTHLGGCPPIPGFDNLWRNTSGEKCSVFNARIFDDLAQSKTNDIIVLAARWSNYLKPPYMVDEHGNVPSLLSRSIFPASDRDWQPFDVEQLVYKSMVETISALSAAGHTVILVRPVAVQDYHAGALPFRVGGDIERLNAFGVSRPLIDQKNALINSIITRIDAANPSVKTVDPFDYFCKDDICQYTFNGYVIYTDDNHLNTWGSNVINTEILNQAIDD